MKELWHITYADENSDSVYRLYGCDNNPQYCLCKRFFTEEHPEYKNFIDVQPFGEIVSVDSALINIDRVLEKGQADGMALGSDEQILCVYCMLDENGDTDNCFVQEFKNEKFCFCGYDIADIDRISVLTNCIGGFSRVFSYSDLNMYGLVQEYSLAKYIQGKLIEEYPDEEHAYCAVSMNATRSTQMRGKYAILPNPFSRRKKSLPKA